MTELQALIEQWEQVGRTQRRLAETEKDIGLRASLIATSNAWMAAANDLRKHMETSK